MDQMPVELRFLEMPPGEVFEAAGVRITPHVLRHPIHTFGYRVEENGSCFVYATDHEPYDEPDLQAEYVEWCREADLLVHDAQYSSEEYAQRVGWGHSSFDYALQVARDAGARQLAFFHHEPLHADHQIEAMVEEALGSEQHRKHRGLIAFPAAEGQELVL